MRIIILQFSGTGNTYTIARLLQDRLVCLGHEVDLFPIEMINDQNKLIANYDMFGIGYPIYGSDLPLIVKHLIGSLELGSCRRAFVFCTQYLYSGDGAAYLAKQLLRKGFTVHQLAHFNMPSNISDMLGFLRAWNKKKLLQRKMQEVSRFARCIDADRKRLKGLNAFSQLLGMLQRVPYQKYEPTMFSHAIKIEPNCVLCGRCVELCPVGNFSIDQGKIVEHDRCFLCYRCVNHCPVKALHIASTKLVRNQYRGPSPKFVIDAVKQPVMSSETIGSIRDNSI